MTRDAYAAARHGWYIYGITRYRAPAGAQFGSGLNGDYPLALLSDGPLSAIASQIGLEEFSQDALRAEGGDPGWLEERVRGHARVLEAVHRDRPVIPLKFGTIFSRRDGVVRMLQQQAADFLGQLDRFEGKDEWGTKVYVDYASLRQSVVETNLAIRQSRRDLASRTPGTAYLLRKRLDADWSSRVEQELGALVDEGYSRLSSQSQDSVLYPVPERRLDNSSRTLILNAAFLVSRSGLPSWMEAVQSISREYPALSCVPSGPWPPFSFANLKKET